jgi:hypothetical protein
MKKGSHPISPVTAAFGVYLPTPKKNRQALLCIALIQDAFLYPQILAPYSIMGDTKLSHGRCIYNQCVTTNVVSSNPAHVEAYSIQHYVIKFVSDLRQVGDFLQVLLFPPPIKLNAVI